MATAVPAVKPQAPKKQESSDSDETSSEDETPATKSECTIRVNIL